LCSHFALLVGGELEVLSREEYVRLEGFLSGFLSAAVAVLNGCDDSDWPGVMEADDPESFFLYSFAYQQQTDHFVFEKLARK
jgi:hypothetical protein